jgi:hypothetical protein
VHKTTCNTHVLKGYINFKRKKKKSITKLPLYKYLHFGFPSAALIDDRNKTSKIITDVVNFIIPESTNG